MKTMTTNSKNSNISNQGRYFSLSNYEIQMFTIAMNFLKDNIVHFDNEGLLGIKELVMDDLDKKKASKKDKDEVAASIDRYIGYYKYEFKANTRKVMIQELDDIFYFCISIIRDASMNGKKSTSKKTIDDYYKSFLEDVDKRRNWLHNLDEADVLDSMFQVILWCKDDGGDFHMVDALENKLGEYLEANYKD